MTFQAICIRDSGDSLNIGQEYTLDPIKDSPGIVLVPGLGAYHASRFERIPDPQAPTPAPTPGEATVAPSDGLAGGVKHDDGKPRMDLLPPEALREIAGVLTMGAQKYDAHNWRRGFAYSRLIAAALRHLFAWVGGENKDPESGKSHLAHAACCLMFLITFEQTNTGTDDRYTI
jgi:hypothetical protein